eukprot:TRINITY_DN15831_c0_g1_i1.p1 TRINITY_DN15831_c0_g1~~TRINITY_DN15831_c0_g1_i1.p1  ORF type:complete len:388 (+),score=101.44 TRINITY_DN15831_c0_g1_i1:74-1165(+)
MRPLFAVSLLLVLSAGARSTTEAQNSDSPETSASAAEGAVGACPAGDTTCPSDAAVSEQAQQVSQQETAGTQKSNAGQAAPGVPKVDRDGQLNAIILVSVVVVFAFGVIAMVVCCTDDTDASDSLTPKDKEMMEMLSKHYLPPCENCGTKHQGNRLCDQCEVVAYCSQECQVVHRPRHEVVCDRLRALRTKHTENPPAPKPGAEDANPGNAMRRGYFVDWQKTNTPSILKDTAAYFVKYWGSIVTQSLANLEKLGKGLVLADVSTERFKDLHATGDPVRIMYLTYGQIRGNPHLAMFTCDRVLTMLQEYNPRTSSVVAFTNGLNYVEREDAMCPVLVLDHDDAKACASIKRLDESQLVTRHTP